MDPIPTPEDLREQAAEEEFGLVTFGTLAKGQADIARAIRADRTRGLVIVSVVIVFAIVFGAWTWSSSTTATDAKRAAESAAGAAERAETATQAIDRDLVERSRGACIRFNVQQKSTREANITLLVEGFRPFVTDLAGLEKFKLVLVPIAEAAWPYRDCSDAGINEFLKNPPEDPAAS